MRRTIVVASAILAVGLAAVTWAHSVGHRPDKAKAGASDSIGIMQLMKNAKGLPEQNYPAY